MHSPTNDAVALQSSIKGNPEAGRVLRCGLVSGDKPAGGYALPMKRYHVTTFGCQMNEHDSERMKGMLESLGYTEASERAEADLILFNTCPPTRGSSRC